MDRTRQVLEGLEMGQNLAAISGCRPSIIYYHVLPSPASIFTDKPQQQVARSIWEIFFYTIISYFSTTAFVINIVVVARGKGPKQR